MTPATLMVMRHCFWNLSSTTSWGGTTMLRGKLAAALAAALAALAIIIIIIAINICLFSAVHSKEPLEEKVHLYKNQLFIDSDCSDHPDICVVKVPWCWWVGGGIYCIYWQIVGAAARRPLGRAESGAPHTVTL